VGGRGNAEDLIGLQNSIHLSALRVGNRRISKGISGVERWGGRSPDTASKNLPRKKEVGRAPRHLLPKYCKTYIAHSTVFKSKKTSEDRVKYESSGGFSQTSQTFKKSLDTRKRAALTWKKKKKP